jgi:hypothetical protein
MAAAAGAGAAAAAAAIAAVAGGAAIIFARSPAEYLANRQLNMGDNEDRKLYYKAVDKLMSTDDLFDLEPANLKGFLDTLKDRANMYGWNDPVLGIMQIPDDPANPAATLDNLLDSYGMIGMERIRNFEETYIAMPDRAAQDSAMLYHCLMSSLTQEAKNAIQLFRSEFMIGDLPSGNLLLRVIIRESHLDSNATTSVLRQQLSRLNEYMPMVNSDVKKFNRHVQELLAALHARGATTHDLLTNLFAGYKAASDKTFRLYADLQESEYFDGKEITAAALMVKMSAKYEQLKVLKLWDAPSEEEEKLLAMQVQLNRLTSKKSDKGDSKAKGDGKGKSSKKPKAREIVADPEWLAKNIKPDSAHKTMMHKGSPWHWCSQESGGKCGGKWRKHKPEECKGISKRELEGKSNGEDPKKLKMAKALQAVEEDNDSTDEEGEPEDF